MSTDLVPHTTGVQRIEMGLAEFGAEDPFEVAFRPARPVLDAVVALRKPMAWLDRRPPLLDLRRAREHREAAVERCEMIPKDPELYRAGKLFEEGECEPAPEAWLHLALGAMLASMPAAANVHDAFRCAIADGAYHDPEIWGPYRPGFSCAAVARSIREARRLDVLPSPGSFLSMCVRHRTWFRRSRMSINDLIAIRQNAEDVLIKLGDDRAADLAVDVGDDWDFDE
jgi:hypothetical protein